MVLFLQINSQKNRKVYMNFHEGLQEQWKDILRLKTKEYIQNLIITHEEEIDKNVFGEILSSLSKDGVPDENIMKLQNEFDEILNDILNTILPSRWVKRETYISKYLKIPKGRISEVWGYENKFKNGKNDKLLRN